MSEHMDTEAWLSQAAQPIPQAPPAKSEQDLTREVTVTRANVTEALARLNEVTAKRAAVVAEYDKKVADAQAQLAADHARFKEAQQALIARVAVDPVTGAAPFEAAPAPVVAVEMDDDDDYDPQGLSRRMV